MVKKKSVIYLCESCGNESLTWAGRCSFCGDWNTLKELSGINKRNVKNQDKNLEIKNISEVKYSRSDRISTGISEVDRVLGGGIVRGSIILLGGEPGIGKSTLTLQIASKIINSFYVSAEESLEQIKQRAERLKISSKTLMLSSSGDLLSLKKEILKQKPDLLIIDSIQTVYMSELDSSAGSLSQVRESGIFLQRFAKDHNVAVLLVGHVTKEGNIAGPRLIEHLVDAVLYLEGERFQEGRILRGVKNRFGATNEIGLFSLEENGMKEINNPAQLFLSEKVDQPGSAVTVIMEGKRPLLIEIQALTISTNFGYAKRTASGFDLNRLNLLSAVIQKKTGMSISNCDIYLNVVGGLKISEPAADLAVVAAIMSSFTNRRIKPRICLYGEVGLMGEIRSVSRHKERQNELQKLGYKSVSDINSIDQIIERCLDALTNTKN